MRACRHNPWYIGCVCDPVSCVLLRSSANPAGLESLGVVRSAWADDEPRDKPEVPRKPARFYAPPGTCQFCDARRTAAAQSMREVRERGRGGVTPISPTDPEPWGDIAAQMEALLDPDHPKTAVWVSRGTASPPLLHAVPHLTLDAGRLYASCARDLSQLAADPSLERLAQILGYLECKADLRVGELPVVQALSAAGWVVQEMASSWELVGEARRRCAAYGPVRVMSMAACHERRRRLLAEELGPCP